MAKKKRPTMPDQYRLEGGRLWTLKTSGVPGYSSDCGNFDILCGDGYVVLVSIAHDPMPGDEGIGCWRKRFSTIQEAMEYAEMM